MNVQFPWMLCALEDDSSRCALCGGEIPAGIYHSSRRHLKVVKIGPHLTISVPSEERAHTYCVEALEKRASIDWLYGVAA